jgi:hypothetical protein
MNAVATVMVAAPVNWKPIEVIPGDRTDGRDVLLWAGYPAIGSWLNWCWVDAVGHDMVAVTHWADIGEPG